MMMLRNHALLFVVTASVITAPVPPAKAQEEDVAEKRTRQFEELVETRQFDELVEQLGDDSFQERETAQARLLEIGLPAEAALREAAGAADAELSFRAGRILREIRRRAFIAGDIDPPPGNADSWKRMVSIVGNTPESRRTFVKMQAAAGDLLTLAEDSPQRCGSRITELYTAAWNSIRAGEGGLPAGHVAAVVLIACDERVELDEFAIGACGAMMEVHVDTLRNDMTFRRLLAHWIDSDPQQMKYLRLVQKYQLRECLPDARQTVDRDENSHRRARACLILGIVGEKADIARLEKLIDDNALLAAHAKGGGKPRFCVLGDVALSMAIALAEKSDSQRLSMSYNLTQFGFADATARETARQRWKERNSALEADVR